MNRHHDHSLFGLRQAPSRNWPVRHAEARDLLFGTSPTATPMQVTGRCALPLIVSSSNRLLRQGN
jgi:hypothetical protein